MISEKDMEDAISVDPEKYLGEKGLKLIARQYTIGNYRFDLLFEDRHGAKLIVEIQKGTLDREHHHKIQDYYEEYKVKNPKDFVDLMVIANRIPYERRRKLSYLGVEHKEIPESEFQESIITDDKAPEAISTRTFNNEPFLTNKSRQVGIWNESNFFQDMKNRCPDEILQVAIKIMEWIKTRRLGPEYGSGKKNGSFFPMINSKGNKYKPFAVYSDGRIEIWFASIKQMQPFNNEQNLFELLFRLNQINGVSIRQESIKKYPGIKLYVFIEDHVLNQFFAVFDWVIQEIKSVESK
jgi:hypothetical protein